MAAGADPGGLDGRPWPAARWLCGRSAGGWLGGALVDLDALAPGCYQLEVTPRGLPPVCERLERVAG